MEFLRQLWRKIKRLIKYTMLYIIFTALFICAFSKIYRSAGISLPIDTIANIFFGFVDINSLPSNVYYICVFQIIVQNIFFVAWIGSFLSRFLKPLNPLFFSKYVVCYNNRMNFKYWVLLPAHKFLYDIHIRIFFSPGPLYNGGKNKLTAGWELRNPKLQNIGQARGVHLVELGEKETKSLLAEIDKYKDASEAKLVIMINGSTADGQMFWGRHPYNVKDFLKIGYLHVPIRQPECARIVNEFSKPSKICEIRENRYLIRYQNFNKIYVPRAAAPYWNRCGKWALKYKIPRKFWNKDVLSYYQIAYGQYGRGVRQSILNITNFLIGIFLDKNSHHDFLKAQKKK